MKMNMAGCDRRIILVSVGGMKDQIIFGPGIKACKRGLKRMDFHLLTTKRFVLEGKRASELGSPALADLIAQDVQHYETDQTLSAADVYERLAGWVWDTVHQGGEVGYGEMIGALGNEYGLYPEELERGYRKCRRVYDRAKRRAELSVKRQEERKRGE
jgi:hypothetical protein